MEFKDSMAQRKSVIQQKEESTGMHGRILADNRPEAFAQQRFQETIRDTPDIANTTQLVSNNSTGTSPLGETIQRKSNDTGLPDRLKSGIENLSGISMDDVKVHRNSSKPAQLNAHAYAQGTDIHLASGQEKHLPHEAWHVVQQKQGRVKPTMQMKGKVNINDDEGLEKEADMMGGKVQENPVQAKITQDYSVTFSKQDTIVQRVLVDTRGNALSEGEIAKLKADYPTETGNIDAKQASLDSFVVRRLSGRLIMQPYAPPSSRDFHYHLPEGFTTTSASDKTNRTVARDMGMPLTLGRKPFDKDMTKRLLASEHGPLYKGAKAIAKGASLTEAGKDRTHHLADSSIRIIVRWLHQNPDWHTSGLNWVINWMKALTGISNVSHLLELMGVNTDSIPTAEQLKTVVDLLSNNTHQVGFGDSKTNQKVVGPFFDASKTPAGFDTPLSLSISAATEGLKNVGVPEEIIAAALAEPVDKKTGERKSSMVLSLPPLDGHPFDKRPPSGGGFGGGFGIGPDSKAVF